MVVGTGNSAHATHLPFEHEGAAFGSQVLQENREQGRSFVGCKHRIDPADSVQPGEPHSWMRTSLHANPHCGSTARKQPRIWLASHHVRAKRAA
jgi:hypothetical protein